MSFSRVPGALSLLFASSLLAQGVVNPDEAVRNWTASPYWWSTAGGGDKNVAEVLGEGDDLALEPMGTLPSSPLPLTAVTPCRIVDTRLANGSFGGPALVGNATRTFNLPSGPCAGLPAGAAAWSLNFTIIGGSGTFANAFLTAWPMGDSQPTVSTLNFNANQLEANAVVVPAGTSGSINVFVNAPAHLIIDINGYYAPISIVNSVNGQSGVVTLATLPPGSSGQTLRHNGSAWVANIALTSDGTDTTVTGILKFPGNIRAASYVSQQFPAGLRLSKSMEVRSSSASRPVPSAREATISASEARLSASTRRALATSLWATWRSFSTPRGATTPPSAFKRSNTT